MVSVALQVCDGLQEVGWCQRGDLVMAEVAKVRGMLMNDAC